MSASARIMARCDELAEITALRDEDGAPDGILRAYLTEEHHRHNARAAEWMQQAGMRTWQDAAGNQCGRLEGREPGLPALMIASHLDTVPNAGRYDGILGVLTGIEVAHLLAPHQAELPFALEVLAFADEEGTRFGATLLGSRAVAGTWDPEWLDLEDSAGTSMRRAFEDFGLDPLRVAEAARRPEELIGYLEAHIEQGPYLEADGRPLGVVSAIAGARRFQITVHGEARHAGGTPYDRRHDALIGASQAVLDVERIGRQMDTVATVGRLSVHPGAVNVVPGRVDLSLDLRAETDAQRDAAWTAVWESVQAFCAERHLRPTYEELHRAPTVSCSQPLMDAVAAGIAAGGEPEPMKMFSRAGHDAMAMAAVTDIGMLFTRCHDGISHHPDESVTEADVAATVDAMLHAVQECARAAEAEAEPLSGSTSEGAVRHG